MQDTDVKDSLFVEKEPKERGRRRSMSLYKKKKPPSPKPAHSPPSTTTPLTSITSTSSTTPSRKDSNNSIASTDSASSPLTIPVVGRKRGNSVNNREKRLSVNSISGHSDGHSHSPPHSPRSEHDRQSKKRFNSLRRGKSLKNTLRKKSTTSSLENDSDDKTSTDDDIVIGKSTYAPQERRSTAPASTLATANVGLQRRLNLLEREEMVKLYLKVVSDCEKKIIIEKQIHDDFVSEDLKEQANKSQTKIDSLEEELQISKNIVAICHRQIRRMSSVNDDSEERPAVLMGPPSFTTIPV